LIEQIRLQGNIPAWSSDEFKRINCISEHEVCSDRNVTMEIDDMKKLLSYPDLSKDHVLSFCSEELHEH
jgi:tricorn protease-like protein